MRRPKGHSSQIVKPYLAVVAASRRPQVNISGHSQPCNWAAASVADLPYPLFESLVRSPVYSTVLYSTGRYCTVVYHLSHSKTTPKSEYKTPSLLPLLPLPLPRRETPPRRPLRHNPQPTTLSRTLHQLVLFAVVFGLKGANLSPSSDPALLLHALCSPENLSARPS
jgi:hypothetical protein